MKINLTKDQLEYLKAGGTIQHALPLTDKPTCISLACVQPFRRLDEVISYLDSLKNNIKFKDENNIDRYNYALDYLRELSDDGAR